MTAEMIAHNIAGVTDPEEVDLMVTYISDILGRYLPKYNRAKSWHDHIFRPRYYYTRCPRTLEILDRVETYEMARHIIHLESFLPIDVVEVQKIVDRIMSAGLYVVLHKDRPYVLQSSKDIVGGYLEIILEGTPFEQEYVVDLKGFNRWLYSRLP